MFAGHLCKRVPGLVKHAVHCACLLPLRFHGKPPSKNKQEQRQRKYLEEVAVARATASENPSAGALCLRTMSVPLWCRGSVVSRIGTNLGTVSGLFAGVLKGFCPVKVSMGAPCEGMLLHMCSELI